MWGVQLLAGYCSCWICLSAAVGCHFREESCSALTSGHYVWHNAGNGNESALLREALPRVMDIARAAGFSLRGSVISLDDAYDCRASRKAIFNRGTTPNLNPNPRCRKVSIIVPKQ